MTVPGLMDALQAVGRAANQAASQAGPPETTINLVCLRASQINDCAVCLDMHTRAADVDTSKAEGLRIGEAMRLDRDGIDWDEKSARRAQLEVRALP